MKIRKYLVGINLGSCKQTPTGLKDLTIFFANEYTSDSAGKSSDYVGDYIWHRYIYNYKDKNHKKKTLHIAYNKALKDYFVEFPTKQAAIKHVAKLTKQKPWLLDDEHLDGYYEDPYTLSIIQHLYPELFI